MRNKIKFRSSLCILGMIITICIVLSIICITFGIHFSDKFAYYHPFEAKSILPFALIFMGILITFFWGISTMYLGITTYFIKQKTVGTIKRSEIRSCYGDEGDIYYIYSWICYTVNNYTYENEGQHNFSTTNEIEIKQKLLEFKNGSKITIYYDCKNPYSILIDNKNNKVWSEILGGIGFILLGLFLSIVIGTLLG